MTKTNKKRKSFSDLIKNLDIFGTTVDFSFQNSHSFGTIGGLIISIIIIAFMIFYSILIILDSIRFYKPFILTSYKSLEANEKINIKTNYPPEFKINDSYYARDLTFNSPNTMKQEISFTLINITDDLKFIPYDPSYIVINGFEMNYENNTSQLAYAALCDKSSFRYANNETFDKLNLNKSYCFYSDFIFRDTYPSYNNTYMGFIIKAKKCVNDTYSIVDKQQNPAYKRVDEDYKNYQSKINQDNNLDNSRRINLAFEIPKTEREKDWILDNRNLKGQVNQNLNHELFYNINKTKSSKMNKILNSDFDDNIEVQDYQRKIIDTNLNTSYNKNSLKNSNFHNKFEFNEEEINIKGNIIINESYYSDSLKTDFNFKMRNLEDKQTIDNSSPFSDFNINVVHNKIVEKKSLNATPLICQPSDRIENMISNLKLLVFFNNFLLNSTKDVNPIIPKVESTECSFSTTLSKEKVLYFTSIVLNTQNSLIPQSLSDRSEFNYYLSIENENIIYGDASKNNQTNSTNEIVYNSNNEDIDEFNEDLLRIIFTLYSYKRVITRRYRDIFEIMGNIGGLSKILMICGFCLIFYYANFRKKEALMNELYANKTNENLENFKKRINDKTKNLITSKINILKNIFNHCENEYLKKGGIQIEERYKDEGSFKEIEENFENEDEIENLEDEEREITENCIHDDIVEKDKRFLNGLCKKIYLELSDDNNLNIIKIWKDKNNDRKNEFYFRIFCRAFVKFYFKNKAETFESNLKLISDDPKKYKICNVPKEDILLDLKKHLIEKSESNKEEWRKEQIESFIDSILQEFINDLEASNYKNLIDNIDTDGDTKFSFNVLDIWCLLCCRCFTTRGFKDRCKEFEKKYEEFLEQTDFNEIINSLHEFKTFKKTYFEKGQLWLFDSCPIKAITYDDENLKNNDSHKDTEKLKENCNVFFN